MKMVYLKDISLKVFTIDVIYSKDMNLFRASHFVSPIGSNLKECRNKNKNEEYNFEAIGQQRV